MIKKTITILAALAILFSGTPATRAQEASTLPEPVQNALDLVKDIKVDINDIPWLKRFSEWGNEKHLQNSSWNDVQVQLKEFWDAANSWVYETIGVTIVEILKTVANLIIWIVETIIGFLKELLARL